jgi:signal transduction histidine kinase
MDEEAAFDIDPVKMSTVLRNFLSNALKFTPRRGHVTVVVDVVDYDLGRFIFFTYAILAGLHYSCRE